MPPERVERKLAAILAADVAGYSRLMGADEAGTARVLREHRAALDPLVVSHHGRIVKTTGDGVLLEFPSIVAAVECAVAVQNLMAERNADLPQDRRMLFRIGINLGDVLIEDDDILGDGVNIAARLEGIAEPGGICISESSYQQVRDKLDIRFEDMGEQRLKNIARPVRVYRVPLGGSPAKERPTLALPDKPSIAVLSFQNMSGDPEQEYFADGMAEDIITGLSRMRWLFVIARNSSFRYKGRSADVKQVGRDLGVRYLLEGSVRRAGSQVRITAQLIETATGAHLWAERYDRALNDIFALQDDITMSVVGAIEPSLRRAEIERVKRKRPENLDAYDLVLRSMPFVHALMPDDGSKAVPLLNRALDLEPEYPAAHANLAWCFHQRFSRAGLREEDRAAAIHHARAAIARGSDDATALAIAGLVIAFDEHDVATATNAFDRALALSSSNFFALACSAVILAWMGKTELAIERAERAQRLSPFDPLSFLPNNALSISYLHSQRFEEAADAARRAIQSNPHFSMPQALLTASLVRLQRVEEAKLAAKRVLMLQPSFTVSGVSTTVGLANAVIEPIADAWRAAGLPA